MENSLPSRETRVKSSLPPPASPSSNTPEHFSPGRLPAPATANASFLPPSYSPPRLPYSTAITYQRVEHTSQTPMTQKNFSLPFLSTRSDWAAFRGFVTNAPPTRFATAVATFRWNRDSPYRRWMSAGIMPSRPWFRMSLCGRIAGEFRRFSFNLRRWIRNNLGNLNESTMM